MRAAGSSQSHCMTSSVPILSAAASAPQHASLQGGSHSVMACEAGKESISNVSSRAWHEAVCIIVA